jgi:hypothetical protein
MRVWMAAGLLLFVAAGPGAAQSTSGSGSGQRRLFDSDMSRMAGLSARDPMAGMAHAGWQWMTMGTARLAFNHQGGPSGDEAVESSNWIMEMAHRPMGTGRLTVMGMQSLEPATVEAAGSPLLFQTGEARNGQPLVDHQHPHDLFMNLSAAYRRPFGNDSAGWAQAALRGEPALGPTAFMHRASAGENPSATLGHHWQDSSHITDLVLTLGGGWREIALEGSVFHGREPDEHRWDLDPGPLDSASVRLRAGPWRDWSAQVSYGFLKHPEILAPGDTRRTTASLHYGAEATRPLAVSFVWGHNREDHGPSDSFLLEGAFALTARDQVYGRAERVEKSFELLFFKEHDIERRLEASVPRPEELTTIDAFTLGYFREVPRWRRVRTGLGADLTFYRFSARLRPVYGDAPVSLHAFLRVGWETGHVMHGAASAPHVHGEVP